MITVYRDGNWYGRKKETKIEVSGTLNEEQLDYIFDIVDNEPDENDKKILEVKKEAEKKLAKANEEKTEMLQPIRTLLKIADDDTVLENSKYLERYEVDKEYKTNDLFRLSGKVFRVIQDHTSQADWIPFETPALYQDLSNTLDEEGNEVISEWEAPRGEHDLYTKGDKVIHENKTWELVGEDTGHAPGLVAGVWEVVE